MSDQLKRRHRIQELLRCQQRLKQELFSAKKALMVQPDSWSYDRELNLTYFFILYFFLYAFI